jgi:hypothetical protein
MGVFWTMVIICLLIVILAGWGTIHGNSNNGQTVDDYYLEDYDDHSKYYEDHEHNVENRHDR